MSSAAESEFASCHGFEAAVNYNKTFGMTLQIPV